jgi:RHS repeat-associated protein
MPLRKQKPNYFQEERRLCGLWVSYKKGQRKNPKLKSGKPVFNCQLSIVHCQFKNVANETLQDVYFDDITGIVRRPKIIQEVEDQAVGITHYYPFGLLMAGISDLGNPEYAYFYTGKELIEDEALQYYDYGARMYDVQIGRWTTHDPDYQYASPYPFCGNDPINYVDKDGRFAFLIPIIIGAAIGAYAGGAIANNSANPFKWEWDKASTYRDMFYGAVVGAGTAWGGAAIAAGIGTAAVSGAATYGAMVGGAAAGFTSSLGFAMIQNHGELDWSDLRRAGYAGLTGLVAGGLGSYIGGYEGAFTGGFTGGAMNTWINGGSIEQGLLAGAIGGGIAVGAYSISMGKAYRDYKRAGGTWNRSQHQKISVGVQRSHARGREWGAWITEDGIESWGIGTKRGVDPTTPKGKVIAEVHTHVNDGKTFEPPSDIDVYDGLPKQKVIGWRNEYNLKPGVVRPPDGTFTSDQWMDFNLWQNYYNHQPINIFSSFYAYPFNTYNFYFK